MTMVGAGERRRALFTMVMISAAGSADMGTRQVLNLTYIFHSSQNGEYDPGSRNIDSSLFSPEPRKYGQELAPH